MDAEKTKKQTIDILKGLNDRIDQIYKPKAEKLKEAKHPKVEDAPLYDENTTKDLTKTLAPEPTVPTPEQAAPPAPAVASPVEAPVPAPVAVPAQVANPMAAPVPVAPPAPVAAPIPATPTPVAETPVTTQTPVASAPTASPVIPVAQAPSHAHVDN